PERTDQSRKPAPETETTSPSPTSPSVNTSAAPCTTRKVSLVSPVISPAATRTAWSAVPVKNTGTGAATPAASTTIFPPAPGVICVVTGAAHEDAKHNERRTGRKRSEFMAIKGRGEV